MSRGIGSILEQEREKIGISLLSLCNGVCTMAELNHICSEEREPDKFLLERLWGRLGKGKEKLELTLGDRDYVFLEIRNLMRKLLKEKDWERLDKVLEYYEELEESEKCLHQQYLHKIKGLQALCEERKELAAKELFKAAACTIPDFPKEAMWKTALSVDELTLVFLYLDTEDSIETEEKIRAYGKLLDFLKKEYIEEEEKARLYPQIVLRLAQMVKEKEILEGECSFALELLRNNGRFFHLGETLSLYIEILERRGKKQEKIELLKKELFYLEELCKEFSQPLRQPRWHNPDNKEVYLDYELLQRSRTSQGLSQEELCEEICAQKTLSRIETGKAKSRATTFRQLAEKLGKQGERCGTSIDADDYEILKLEKKEVTYISRYQFEKAEKVFQELAGLLKDTAKNRQYILLEQAIYITKKTGDYKLSLEKLEKAAECTLSEGELKNIETCFLTYQEVSVLNNIAIAKYRIGKKEEAIDLLKKLVKNYENSRVDVQFHSRGITLIRSNLASYLEETKDYDGSLKVCRKALQFAFQMGNGSNFQRFITTKACVLEDQKKKAESIRCFTQAFYISCLMKDNETAKLIQKHLAEAFCVEI